MTENYPDTVDGLLALSNVPVVAIDRESLFTYINEAFTMAYGWSPDELIGKPVMKIMPKHMRSAHMVGFARFLTTETPTLLGKPLPLTICYKDGREEPAIHYILGDKSTGTWRFAAIIDQAHGKA